MKFGLYGINIGDCADPSVAVRVARAAEDAGFESLWTAEHVVLPEPCPDGLPLSPHDPFLHPAPALAYIAAHTETIRLATGVTILPQHNAVVLAKEFASLDVISKGRVILGFGIGYLPQEFDALGIPFQERGARADEGIAVLRDLWTSSNPAFAGRFYHYANIQSRPWPVQRPHPPILIGGMSAPAFRRAVAHGNGWYGFGLDAAATEQCLEGLRTAATRVERPDSLGPLEITVTPAATLDRAALERYREIGVERLVLRAEGSDEQSIREFVEHAGRTFCHAKA